MVVFEDGLARKSEYRRFEVRSVEGQDDVASLREVLTRRLARLATERDEPEDETGRRKKFAYPPNLIVVDGAGLSWPPPWRRCGPRPAPTCRGVAGQADGGVYVPGTPDPVVIPRPARPCTSSSGSATRPTFAITYHRKLRDRSMTRSVLDGIPGVGRPGASWCATSARPARPPRPAWRSWSRFPGRPPAC